MVPEFDDLAWLAFENDHHAAPNLSCRNCHNTGVSVDRGNALCELQSA
jgi:hypothetical protein